MAASAAAVPRPLDLRSSRTHTVQLGDSLRKSDTAGLVSLKYNHKPVFDSVDGSSAVLAKSQPGATSKLTLKENKDVYEYEGSQDNADTTLVLLPDETGDGWLLERLEAAWLYNLSKAPWESDKHKLAEQYPKLSAQQCSSKGEREDEADDESHGPEANNPFDWRHYFSPTSPSAPQPTQSISARPSPTLNSVHSRQSTPLSRPVKKTQTNPMLPNQRKPRQTPVPQHKRQKSDSTPVPQVRVSSHPAVTQPKRKPAPKVAVEDIDLALESPTTDANDADLILDDTQPSKWKRGTAMGKAMSASLGVSDGPISLRSAASSPGSHVGSPAAGGRHTPAPATAAAAANDDGDLVMDEDEPPLRSGRNEAVEEDEDVDVEDLALPSPVRDRKASAPGQGMGRRRSSTLLQTGTGEVVDGDDDDELEAGLMEAMMADDDDGLENGGGAVVIEDEEESEEE